jgi:hypothetical protein
MVGSDSGAKGCPADLALIRQVKQYMRDWFSSARSSGSLTRGFSSANNRRSCSGRPRLHHRGETALRIPAREGGRCRGRAAISRLPGTCRSRKSESLALPTDS